MSTTGEVYTIMGALAALEKHLGAPAEWAATTKIQEAFLRDVYAVCRPEVDRIPEIESCGSTRSEELRAFAARRGLSVSIPPFGLDEAGAVSVLDFS